MESSNHYWNHHSPLTNYAPVMKFNPIGIAGIVLNCWKDVDYQKDELHGKVGR
jgi:hypothetical protein